MPTTPDTAGTANRNGNPELAPGRGSAARRGPSATATRRQVADRLRQRREREEELVVAAADGLARRAAALHEANEAGEAAGAAITALQAMGFTLDDLAEVLDVSLEDLTGRTAPKSGPGSAARAKDNGHASRP
jgi:hypothetical protein